MIQKANVKSAPLIKLLFDYILTLIGFVILSPIFLVITLIIIFTMGFPIIFKQKRPGYHNRIFTIYKFRTMQNVKDEKGKVFSDQERLTKLGKFLRSTSLDELPELWNVLKGDMSLVGPRPLLVEYLDLYSPEQARRHDVNPGITGLAQVNGRNSLTWQEKFAYDVWYVDNWSFWLDMKILILTLWKVIAREGISQQGKATSDPFMGNPITPQDSE
ncbi:MAG: sugar transferase [Anaerolineaceae bacterium]|nr:sugar transferase [Anaerolineaceae bacterium]